MQMFEYIIVLISIVIGLALTHLMQGIAGLVQHPGRNRVWWVHLGWVAMMFLNTVFWWWWEFRLQTIETWTFQLYLFVVCYAFLVYVICAMLFPKDLEGYEGYKDYFLSRRQWFFGLLIAFLVLDVFDTLAKGTEYFAAQGLEYVMFQSAFLLLSVVGMVTRRERVHATLVVIVLSIQISRVLLFYNTVN